MAPAFSSTPATVEPGDGLEPRTVELVRMLSGGGRGHQKPHHRSAGSSLPRPARNRRKPVRPSRFADDTLMGEELDEQMAAEDAEEDEEALSASQGLSGASADEADADGVSDGGGGERQAAPASSSSSSSSVPNSSSSNTLTVPKPRRGRPPNNGNAHADASAAASVPLPKRRGRPPRYLKDMEIYGERKDDDGFDDSADKDHDHHYSRPGERQPVRVYTKEERRERLERYREKQKNRKFLGKRVIYRCRKEFADQRPRMGGRFIKKTPEEKAAQEAEKQRKKEEKKQQRLVKKRQKQEEKDAERAAKRVKSRKKQDKI